MDPGASNAGHAPATVEVWRVGLDPPAAALAHCRSVLSGDEQARMQRYRFDVHRRRFCAGRGALRTVLGRYLNTKPSAVEFVYGEQGKPSLAPAGDLQFNLQFNVSHSADQALIAVSRGPELGIDIERVKPDIDTAGIAGRFFSPSEVRCLMAHPVPDRAEAFFECWTRKESLVKALGGGLQLPLDGFDVAFGPGVEARLLRVAWDPEAVERWSMAALSVAPGFRGAITVAGAFGLSYRDASDLL